MKPEAKAGHQVPDMIDWSKRLATMQAFCQAIEGHAQVQLQELFETCMSICMLGPEPTLYAGVPPSAAEYINALIGLSFQGAMEAGELIKTNSPSVKPFHEATAHLFHEVIKWARDHHIKKWWLINAACRSLSEWLQNWLTAAKACPACLQVEEIRRRFDEKLTAAMARDPKLEDQSLREALLAEHNSIHRGMCSKCSALSWEEVVKSAVALWRAGHRDSGHLPWELHFPYGFTPRVPATAPAYAPPYGMDRKKYRREHQQLIEAYREFVDCAALMEQGKFEQVARKYEPDPRHVRWAVQHQVVGMSYSKLTKVEVDGVKVNDVTEKMIGKGIKKILRILDIELRPDRPGRQAKQA